MKFILGGWNKVGVEGVKMGSGGSPLGKFVMTTPPRSLEDTPFLENLLLTEAKNQHWWGLSRKVLKRSLQFHKDTYYFWVARHQSHCTLDRYTWIWIFISMTLALTAFFTYKINKLQQIIGRASAPPSPLLLMGLYWGCAISQCLAPRGSREASFQVFITSQLYVIM